MKLVKLRLVLTSERRRAETVVNQRNDCFVVTVGQISEIKFLLISGKNPRDLS